MTLSGLDHLDCALANWIRFREATEQKSCVRWQFLIEADEGGLLAKAVVASTRPRDQGEGCGLRRAITAVTKQTRSSSDLRGSAAVDGYQTDGHIDTVWGIWGNGDGQRR